MRLRCAVVLTYLYLIYNFAWRLFVCINPLPSDRLRCCDRYIRCQRSLAVKPLTMSGSPSHRGSVRRVSRSQVTHVPISNCSCSMCTMTVSKLMSTCGNYSCASGGDGRCASNGGFLNGRARRLGPFSMAGARRLRAFVHYRSSHNCAKLDCGLLSLFTLRLDIRFPTSISTRSMFGNRMAVLSLNRNLILILILTLTITLTLTVTAEQ